MKNGLVLGFCLPLLASFMAIAGGCTVTTTNDSTTDGGSGTPTPGTDSGTTPGTDGGGGGGLLGFTPTNVASVLAGLDTSALPDVELTDATTEHLSLIDAVHHGAVEVTATQTDGSTIDVLVVKSLKIGPSSTLLMDPKTPVAIVALTTVEIFGKITAQAVETEPTAGGGRYPDAPGKGAGAGGGGSDNTHVGWGGGGASHCGAGGKSGLSTGTSGAAGQTYGNAQLSPLTAGSAGGSISFGAGAGGGAFQISAGTSITLGPDSVLSAGGGGGVSGTPTNYNSQGAGSGGAILLEAPTVTVSGIIQANGGGGGAGSGASTAGQRGSDATNDATPAPGAFPGTTGQGGNGSGGSVITGTNGADGDAVGGAALPGAGGGGAGWIRINTKTGAATLGGTISPSMTTSCATQGTLAP